MKLRLRATCAGILLVGCVPSGSAGPQDSGPAPVRPREGPAPVARTATTAAADLLTAAFEDTFDRPGPPTPAAPPTPASPPADAIAPLPPGADPGPNWLATMPGLWRVEGGRLCGEHAKNHGIWLKRTLPLNARIEFDAVGVSVDGDLKAEYWGDGRSFATSLSYTNATSYLTIYGGWHNKFHVLARLNEHGNDREEIPIDPSSDDPREKPVVPGQSYHFKVERADGKNVKWWIDGNEMLTFKDAAPLAGPGHDHFGFNDWDVKVCFDNLKIVPLP